MGFECSKKRESDFQKKSSFSLKKNVKQNKMGSTECNADE